MNDLMINQLAQARMEDLLADFHQRQLASIARRDARTSKPATTRRKPRLNVLVRLRKA